MKRNTIEAIPAERYNKLIKRLGLSQNGTARFFDVSLNAARRYARGEVPIDPRTAMLLEIMVKHEIAPDEAVKLNRGGAMTADHYGRLIKRLGLSQRGAARFFGINDRTARHYSAGTAPVDRRTGMLLEAMVKHKIAPDDALRLIGVRPRAAAKAAVEATGYPTTAPRYYDYDEA